MKNVRFAGFICLAVILGATYGFPHELALAKLGARPPSLTFTRLGTHETQVSLILYKPLATALPFTDVTEQTRYYEAILALASSNIIHGFGDGTFRALTALKRAELVKLLVEAKGITLEPKENFPDGCFDDVHDINQWYFRYICSAKNHGIAKGYDDNTFRPGNTVNRAEALALTCRTFEWPTKTPETLENKPFSDTPLGEWFTPCIAYAKNEGFLKKITKKLPLVRPGMSMLRGAYAEILYRALLKTGRSFVIEDEKAPEPLILGNQLLSGLSKITDIRPLQQEMLSLTNAERAKIGLAVLGLNDELSAVAQLHSNNMAQRNFFDHIDPLTGKSPDDRRLDFDVTTLVGENLAKAPSIETAHEGLMNSPPHRKNILMPEWTRVGLGVAQDQEGYLLITQIFSTTPITADDLRNEKIKIFTLINTLRQSQDFPALDSIEKLDELSEGWSREMAEQNFFSAENPSGEKLLDRVKNQFEATYYQVALYESNKLEIFGDLVTQDPARYLTGELEKIGLGFAMDEIGMIELTVILTN